MTVRTAILLCALLPIAAARACPPDAAHPIASLRELPADLLNLLGRFEKPRARIADIGEKFNASDVIFPDSPPQQRLVSGIATKDCVELKVEFGGIGYFTRQFEFQRNPQGWAGTKGDYNNPFELAPAALPRR